MNSLRKSADSYEKNDGFRMEVDDILKEIYEIVWASMPSLRKSEYFIEISKAHDGNL